MDLIDAALRCNKSNGRFAYVAPTYTQAKDVAWTYLKQFTYQIPGVEVRESDLSVLFPNGARVRLYGADNYDRLRGLYLDGIVLDEFADMYPQVWPEVVRPALADRKGWATFIGTPKGRNIFWEIFDQATRDPDWFTLVLRADETGILDAEELESARKLLSEDAFSQEFLCSFDAAVIGSYFGKVLDEAQGAGRICSVPYEPSVRVQTAWDLGVGDSTAIWFYQQVGREVRVIDYLEMTGEGLPYYAKELDRRGYLYGRHVAPHDIAVRELGSGRSRYEIAEGLGIRFDVAPNLPVDDGINAVRLLIPRCWFDAEKCRAGLEKLRLYRKSYDERLRTFRDRPVHDHASHAADAFRYLAIAMEEERQAMKPPAPVSSSWMG